MSSEDIIQAKSSIGEIPARAGPGISRDLRFHDAFAIILEVLARGKRSMKERAEG